MKKHLQKTLFFVFAFFLASGVNAQTITLDMLKGSWEVKASADLKTFGDYKLQFNNINSHCYLKSVWTFDSDSTGFITVNSSEKCPDPSIARFTYVLFEAPSFNYLYRMEVHFANGTVDKLALSAKDGQKNLEIGYNQALAESTASNNRVWIYFSLKKKS